MGRLVKRFGEAALVAAGFAGMALGYATLGVIGTVPPLVIVSAFSGMGNALLRPNLSSLITQAAGRGEQGVVIGLSQSLGSIAQIVAPMLGGFLIEKGLLTAWASVAAAAAGAGLVLGAVGLREGAATAEAKRRRQRTCLMLPLADQRVDRWSRAASA